MHNDKYKNNYKLKLVKIIKYLSTHDWSSNRYSYS